MLNALKVSVLSVVLAAGTASSLVPWVQAATQEPFYCKHRPPRGLTPEQEKTCSLDELEAQKQKAAELNPPKYPVMIDKFLSIDQATGKQNKFNLSSENGKTIIFNFQDKPLTLDTSNVTAWNAAVAGTGTDSRDAVTIGVVSALFFWPGLLLVPFASKKYTIMGFQVNYIDNFGRDKALSFATIEAPKPTLELLRYSTGLEAGKGIEEASKKQLYAAGLKQSLQALPSLREKVSIFNTRKPWCTKLELKDNTQEVKDYKEMITNIKLLNQKLSMPEYEDIGSASQEKQWQIYLEKNPGMKAWAAANKSQAELLKKC